MKPLVGNTPYSVQNTQDFIHSIQDIKLQDDECMVSYDVEALFTSVPVKPAITIIQKKLEADKDLHLRTKMSSKQIISLLEFCLTSTYFTYQGRFYEQTEGIAMGSPMSPIVANLFMEELEIKALTTSPHKPSLWKRFVDDTFIIIKKAHKDSLLQHLIPQTATSSSHVRNLEMMAQYLSWTSSSFQEKKANWTPLYTGSPPIQTYICNGTAITTFQLNTV